MPVFSTFGGLFLAIRTVHQNKMLTTIIAMTTNLSNKFETQFYCQICDYSCRYQSDFNKHLMTRKHKNQQKSTQCQPKQFTCHCGKSYKERTGLWKHHKKCNFSTQDTHDDNDNNDDDDGNGAACHNNHTQDIEQSQTEDVDYKQMFIESLKQNQELQKAFIVQQQQISDQQEQMTTQQQQISDQQRQLTELIPKVGNTNNTTNNNTTNNNTTNNNNQFNLNFFLNEQCKDAIPLIDFVKSLQYDFDQLEYTGKHGFVEGVSKIIMDAINELDITKRPIHCTDVKRETFYVKEDESWKKEDERNRSIKTAIHNIRNRNLACVPEWIRAHPNCKKMDDPNNDLFIEIIGQYMDASEKEFNKVIKTIAKSLTIPKNKYGRKPCPV